MTNSSAVARRRSSGTTRFTRPQSSACAALIGAPVSSISAARPGPIIGDSNAAWITDGTPTRTSGRPKEALAADTRRSHASASSKPAPRHGPFTAAITGNGARCTAAIASWSVVIRSRARPVSRSRSTRTSIPAVNARPLPTTTATRVARSAASSENVSCRARIRVGSKRLSGGRSSVHQTAAPARWRVSGAPTSIGASRGQRCGPSSPARRGGS